MILTFFLLFSSWLLSASTLSTPLSIYLLIFVCFLHPLQDIMSIIVWNIDLYDWNPILNIRKYIRWIHCYYKYKLCKCIKLPLFLVFIPSFIYIRIMFNEIFRCTPKTKAIHYWNRMTSYRSRIYGLEINTIHNWF